MLWAAFRTKHCISEDLSGPRKKNRTYYQHKKASKLAKNQRNMQITQQIKQIIHLLWLDADDKSKVF